jgi:hypothetical protein
MSLDDIVNVNISVESSAPSRAGFGVPMVLDYHTRWTEMIRSYTSAKSWLDDGGLVSDAAYVALAAIFSQNPKIPRVKVGRRLTAPTWRIELTPTAANLAVYSGKILLPGGTVESFSFTSDGTATVAEITAGLTAAINALIGTFTATDQTTFVRVVADTAGKIFQIYDLSSNLAFANTTVNAGIVPDLAAVEAVDGDWYGVISTSKGDAEILALAAAIETRRKLFVVASSDSEVLTGSTTDIASDLKLASYNRTALLYHSNESSHPEAAWMGKLFPFDPGSETWKFKTLAGVTVDALSDTKIQNAKGKNAGVYTTVAGLAITEEGKVADGEFIDVVRFIDFIHARLQEEVFGALANARKIAYTDLGVSVIEGIIRGVLQLGINQGGFASTPAPTVTVPKVADISPVDRANRLLPDITFTATLAGAIHAVEISGTVSV